MTGSFPWPLFILFPAVWMLVSTMIRAAAGFHRGRCAAVAGQEPIAVSRWSSGKFGIVNINNALKVTRYRDGFLCEIMWLFLGGHLWIPDAGITGLSEKKFLFWRYLEFTCDGRRIMIRGDAARLIRAYVPTPPAAG